MKKALIFLLLLITFQAIAQTNPITGINISLPANPDANIANWGTGVSQLTITANGAAVNGRVNGFVVESKILVIIKKNGAKICGTYTPSTAPSSNFNTLTKVWSGSTAVSLLGQSCILPLGDYELSVQFFINSNGKFNPLSEEKTKAFTVRKAGGNEQEYSQLPQPIAPSNETIIKEIDFLKPITFRWTPVIPRPQEPVTYRLRVWQLMEGQNGTQAMRTNQPIITKDVDNLNQAIITSIYTGPCKPPYLCNFVWSVQALNRKKEVVGPVGMSESFAFSFSSTDKKPPMITLLSPANGSNLAIGEKPTFRWKITVNPVNDAPTVSLKIVEIVGEQLPEQALRTNKPIFEKDSLRYNRSYPNADGNLRVELFQYPATAPKFEAGKRYAWTVGSAPPSVFSLANCDVNLSLKLRSVECLPDADRTKRYKINFSSTYSSHTYNLTYTQTGSGLTVYHPSYSPNYAITSISPVLQIQNSGASTTVNYSFEVSVPIGQTAIKIGLQGDDKDPGPITCKPGAELDVTLPICTVPICDCGKWGNLNIKTAAAVRPMSYECGSRIAWKCNQVLSFSNSYKCNTIDASCVAKTSWEIKKGDVVIKKGNGLNNSADTFKPTENGTYTLTLNANCGGKDCPPCTYTIVVEGCPPVVDPCKNLLCNTDFEQFLNITAPTTFVQTNQKNIPCWTTTATDKLIEIWRSGSTSGSTQAASGNYFAELNATQTGTLSQTFNVTAPIALTISFAHRGRYTGNDIMEVSLAKFNTITNSYDAPIFQKTYAANKTAWITTTLVPITIPSTALGNYILQFKSISSDNGNGPKAGGNFLDAIKATCKEVPPVCDCGKWGPFKIKGVVTTISGMSAYNCGGKTKWKCNQPFSFTNTYKCSITNTNCTAKTSWEITKDGVVIKTGTGGNAVADSFTPTSNGIYTITLKANCNSKECPPCTYTIVVEDCKPVVDPCKNLLCNTDFEQFLNITAPTTFVQTNQKNIPCWTTTATDKLIEIWKGNNNLPAASGSYFAELNATQAGTLSQTFNVTAPIALTISFAHRGRYTGDDIMEVFMVNPSGPPTPLGTYAANKTAWITTTLAPLPLAIGTYTLQFKSISSDNGNGPKAGGNFLDAIKVTCKEVPPVCDCGKWGSLNVRTELATGVSNRAYECGSRINWSCKQPFQFTSNYTCTTTDASCVAKTTWEVRKGEVLIKSGTGTNTLSDGFSLLTNGTYTLTLNAKCGDKECKPCTYTIIVEDCKPAVDPCKNLLCNTDFEQFLNIVGPTTSDQIFQKNIPCWKTTATDGLIEIWHDGNGGVPAHSGNYFAELNAAKVGILSQTFTTTAATTISISFAHRGRYAGNDSLQVFMVSNGISTSLGTYAANNTKWIANTIAPHPLAAGTHILQFKSISSNDGKGPYNGGNFLDAITVCEDVPSVVTCNCAEKPWDAVQKIVYNDGIKKFGQEIKCLGKLERKIKTGSKITYYVPDYICAEQNCKVTYNWKMVNIAKGIVYSSGTTTSFPIDFTAPTVSGDYKFEVTPVCGTTTCRPCGFNFTVAR